MIDKPVPIFSWQIQWISPISFSALELQLFCVDRAAVAVQSHVAHV